jgi:hypothetical protein
MLALKEKARVIERAVPHTRLAYVVVDAHRV